MKPISMKMSAFLSYGEEQEIDFTKFGDSGLYLITGETGAGKTTIFDGIVYALYGETSGEDRDGKMLRSKYADIHRDTYVELLFECGGKKYRVKRNPKYIRAKKRGEGTAEQPAYAELESFDGNPMITKTEEVTSAVQNIIGLTKEQFSQIAMIAQGKFRELLLTETKRRREIFRHIFETANFDLLQQTVSQDSRDLNAKIDEAKRSIDQEISGITWDEGIQNDFSFAKSTDGSFLDNKIIKPLASMIERDNEEYDRLEEELTKLEKSKKEASAKVERAEKLENDVKEKTEKEKELNKCCEELEKAESELKNAKEAEPRIDALKAEIAVEETKFDDYDTLDKTISDKAEEEKKLDNNKDLLEKNKTDSEKLKRELESKEVTLKTLSDVGRELEAAKAMQNETIQKLETCEKISERFEELRNKEKEIGEALNKARKKQEEADKASEKVKKLRRAYFREQAGFLAQDLEEGKKCPVCGSIHHPEPAVLSDEAVSREEVNQAEDNDSNAHKEAIKASEEVSSLRRLRKEFKDETERQARELTDNEDLEAGINSFKEDLKKKYDESKAQIKKLEQDEKTKKCLEETIIPDIREKQDKTKGEISRLNTEIATNETQLKHYDEIISMLHKKLKYESRKVAQKYVDDLRNEENKLQDNIVNAEENYKELKSKYDGLDGKIRQLDEQIASYEKLDLQEQNKILSDLEEKSNCFTGQKESLHTKLENNKDRYKRIKRKQSEVSDLLEHYIWMKALDDTLSGKLPNNKIMLETYVQQAYFDRIVAKANIRFEKMSQGHYTLSRIKEPIGGNKQSGLDLEVIDHYNGSRRSVKSLSGGEQFEASLSMALGLSDMVQETSAGVKLDCMFIDEGFGSLDNETLSRALVALRDLSEGNRLVGIISHVNELQREIDNKIVVTKDARGFSKATVG